MKIGIVYPQIELQGDPEAVRRIGLAVEELGFDHLLIYDHVLGASHDREPKLSGPYTDKDPFHDPFVLFAYLAGMTNRIELVTGIVILPQRQTALVARQAADLDLFSQQRLRLGVGSGWNYVEYQALGQEFHTRGKRMDEQIPLLRRLWSEPLVSFDGRFDHIDRASINPRPRRSIPIWVGGFGDAAFQRGATLGDGFIYAGKLDVVLEAQARVKQFLLQAGRSDIDFGHDFVTLMSRGEDKIADAVERWRDAGGTHVSIVTMGHGFKTTDEHIDFIRRIRDRVGVK